MSTRKRRDFTSPEELIEMGKRKIIVLSHGLAEEEDTVEFNEKELARSKWQVTVLSRELEEEKEDVELMETVMQNKCRTCACDIVFSREYKPDKSQDTLEIHYFLGDCAKCDANMASVITNSLTHLTREDAIQDAKKRFVADKNLLCALRNRGPHRKGMGDDLGAWTDCVESVIHELDLYPENGEMPGYEWIFTTDKCTAKKFSGHENE